MKILNLPAEDYLKFNELTNSYGTVFNTIEWTSIFGNNLSRYGIYDKGNMLIGGFVLYSEKKFGLSVYRNPPYTPNIGPFLKIDASNPVSILDLWKKTLSLLSDFLEKLPYSIISYALDKNIIDMQPFIWKKFKVSPRYTYLLDLGKSVDNIWKSMSNERRKNINKALKDGLYTSKIANREIIKNLVCKTFARQKKPINEIYLNRILFDFANSDNSFAFATFQNESPIACSFCIHDSKTAYYLLGGYDNENSHHGAGTLSMWEAIKHSQNIGLERFDFEGSMIPRVETYFRGFGGRLTPYYQINKARLPLEILLKFFKREIF
jgi:hypothetical protein